MDKTLNKLKRLEGQVSSIRTMYTQGRDCMEIVQQIAAARSALAGVAKDLLTDEASRCAQCNQTDQFDKVIKSLFDVT